MKAKITITDQKGNVFEGEIDLAPTSDLGRQTRKPSRQATKKSTPAELNFSLNERAFIKNYASGVGGPKRFVLLLAYLAGGEVGKEVVIKDIRKHWNKMTASNLLGVKFNGFYSTTAKEQGWVNTAKQGVYVLSGTWKDVLGPDNE